MSRSRFQDAAIHWGIVMHGEHYGSLLHANDRFHGGIGPQKFCDHCVFEHEQGITLSDENRKELSRSVKPTAHAFVWEVTGGGDELPKRVDVGHMVMALNDPTLRMGPTFTLNVERR